VAASEGHLDICRFLVARGARINRVDRWGGAPLDDAHRGGHDSVVQFLGQSGGKFGNAAAAIDKFINAASQGDVEQVRTLLKFGNIDVNQGDYDRRTALHLAAGEGRMTIVKLLLEAGAYPNVEDRWGNRPLNDAKNSEKHSASIVKLLVQYGATSGADDDPVAAKKQGLQTDSSVSSLKEQAEKKGQETSGTLAYWAQELVDKNGAEPTPAADMWAAGVIVYILLTGSHPFDKNADASDEEIVEILRKVGSTSKARDGEEQLNLMDELVFDDRIEGLSDSCVELMRSLMHPDPAKRMTSDDFRKHPCKRCPF